MAKVTLELEGFAEYLDVLKKAGEDIDKVAEQALEVGADVLLDGMKKRASFSRRITQNLRRTVVMADGNKRYLYLGILRDTPKEIARMANTWEFGGRSSPSKKNPYRINRPGIEMRSYIRTTLRNDAKKARAAIEEMFQNWVKG